MRRAPCAGSTRLSSLASTSTREPGWMSVQCACQVCVVSARVWRGCREGGHARATSIASSVAAGERAGCTMHHEPRGSCSSGGAWPGPTRPGDIGHLAGSWFSFLASTFLVGGPQIPKDPGFGGFRPIPVPLVPSIWPKNACVMPNSKSRLPGYLATKKAV